MINLPSKIGNYKIISQLKGGAQGFVYVVEDMKTKEKNILKSMFIEESKKEEFEKMVKIWKGLCESKAKDYIVKYKEHFYEGTATVLIMEYCVGGDLDDLIKKKAVKKEVFSETEIMKTLFEGMSALSEMHFHYFIHRDVKAANMLIGDDGKLKMTDFNTSKILEGNTKTGTFAGTLEYTAPEIINNEEYGCSVDIFSFGVILYQMMVGKTPFVNERGLNMKNLIQSKYVPISAALGYSVELVDLVHSCLSLDPTLRPTATTILALPFVTKAQETAALHSTIQSIAATEVDIKTAGLVREVQELRGKLKKAETEAEVVKRELAMMKEKTGKEMEEMRQRVRRLEERLGGGDTATPSYPSSPTPPSSSLLPLRFKPNPVATADGSSIVMTDTRVVWEGKNLDATFVVDYEMRQGRYKIEINGIGAAAYNMRNIFVGLCSKETCLAEHDKPLQPNLPGTCFFNSDWVFCGARHDNAQLFVSAARHLFGLEYDADFGVLYLFVDGVQIPHTVVKVPKAVYFAVYGYYKTSTYELRSLQKLKSATVSSSVACTPHPWK